MTRMMEQVGGGKSALEEKMKVLNVGALFQTSPTSSGYVGQMSSVSSLFLSVC